MATAAQEAAEVLELAVAPGKPPGPHSMADVSLEYQLARPGTAGAQLGRLLVRTPTGWTPCPRTCGRASTAAAPHASCTCTPTPSTTGSTAPWP